MKLTLQRQELGDSMRLVRAFLRQLPEIQIQGAGGLLERLAHWNALGEIGQHTQALGTLTGKDESGFRHAFASLMSLEPGVCRLRARLSARP